MVAATANSLQIAARKAIHVKRRQLAMEDADYRALLRRVAGVDSSTQLTPSQVSAVLREMDRLGAPGIRNQVTGGGNLGREAPVSPDTRHLSPENEWRFTFHAAAARQPYLKKIYILAVKIGEKQTPPVPVMSKAWVEGTVRQSAGLNAPGIRGVAKPLPLCETDELHRVIQILAEWLRKLGGKP
ncbi:hypothetical protein AGMMS50256_25860 [Betaproteobacteria bacterium]|nr:hypothetical protein AGMMS50256_25860 [Betaproteobacteria bacterium]